MSSYEVIELLSDDDDGHGDNDVVAPTFSATKAARAECSSLLSTTMRENRPLPRKRPRLSPAPINPYIKASKTKSKDCAPVLHYNNTASEYHAKCMRTAITSTPRTHQKQIKATISQPLLQAGLVLDEDVGTGPSDDNNSVSISVDSFVQQQEFTLMRGKQPILFEDAEFPPLPSSIQGSKKQDKKITCRCRGSIPAKLDYISEENPPSRKSHIKFFRPIYRCKKNQCKFFCHAFQAERMHWYRLGNHTGHVVVNSSGFSANDLCQGRVGDCWFLSALAVVANRPDLILRLFGNGQFTQLNDYGICQVKLFLDGYWKTVVVDNFFPCIVDGNAEMELQYAIQASLGVTKPFASFEPTMMKDNKYNQSMNNYTRKAPPTLTHLMSSSKYNPNILPDQCREVLRDTQCFLEQDISRKVPNVLYETRKVAIQSESIQRQPTSNDLAYSKAKSNQLWVPILEKAYAKSHGCYQAISGGHIAEAFLDLTGAPTLVYHFDSPDFHGRSFWEDLMKFRRQRLPMGCGTAQSQVGIIGMHAYSILDVVEVKNVSSEFFHETGVAHGNVSGFTEFDGTVRLLQIRNPHGKSEWKGEFSDHSDVWEKLLKHQRNGISADSEATVASLERTMRNDGKFWIDYDSFLMGFTNVDVVLAFLGNHAKSFGTNFPPKRSNHRCMRAFEVSLLEEQPDLPVQDTVELYIMGIQKTRRGAGHGRVDRKVSYKVCDMGILVGEGMDEVDKSTKTDDKQCHRFANVKGQMFGFQRNGHMKLVLDRRKTKSLVLMPISFGHPSATDKDVSFVVRFVSDAPLMIRELAQVPRLDYAIQTFCVSNNSQNSLGQGIKRVNLEVGPYRVFEVDCLGKGGGTVFLYLHVDKDGNKDHPYAKGLSFVVEARCRGMSCRTEEGLLQHETLGKGKMFEADWRRFEVSFHRETRARLLAVLFQSGQDYEFGGISCQLLPPNLCLQQRHDTLEDFMDDVPTNFYSKNGIFNGVEQSEAFHIHGDLGAPRATLAHNDDGIDSQLEQALALSLQDSDLQLAIELSKNSEDFGMGEFTENCELNRAIQLSLEESTKSRGGAAPRHTRADQTSLAAKSQQATMAEHDKESRQGSVLRGMNTGFSAVDLTLE